MNYRQHYSTRQTPQSEPIPGKAMVKNDAGGYAFGLDDWARLDRFLILGSSGGSYYVSEQKLTIDNADAVKRCIAADGLRTVSKIVEISDAGRAPKNDPALFALAMCAGMGNNETRQAALDALPQVARIGTHLFHFLEYVEGFRGWGRGLRRAVGNWYNNMATDKLAYQVIKYQQRDGWGHRDALRLAHPDTKEKSRNDLYKYITSGKVDFIRDNDDLVLVQAFEQAKETETKNGIIKLITDFGLTREMIPTQWLNEPDVWAALLPKMPLTALTRNLGKMTSIGLLKPMSNEAQVVVGKLTDKDYIKKSRLHPLSVLVAHKTYAGDHGLRGSLSWSPVGEIINALDDAFYLAFNNVEPTNKRTALALDVSGSMDWGNIAGMPLTPREVSGAMAMVTARTEPRHLILAFSHQLVEVSLSNRQRLDDVIKVISNIPMGGTDCALPMLGAMQAGIDIDTFVIYTDSETWAGNIHPVQALEQYRQKTGIPAKLIVVGMVSNGFTIADPDDAGMLDVVGFDAAAPRVVANFSKN